MRWILVAIALTPLACGQESLSQRSDTADDPGSADNGLVDVTSDAPPHEDADAEADAVEADPVEADPIEPPPDRATTQWGLTSGAAQLSSERYRLTVHVAAPQPMARRGGEQYTLWLGVVTDQPN